MLPPLHRTLCTAQNPTTTQKFFPLIMASPPSKKQRSEVVSEEEDEVIWRYVNEQNTQSRLDTLSSESVWVALAALLGRSPESLQTHYVTRLRPAKEILLSSRRPVWSEDGRLVGFAEAEVVGDAGVALPSLDVVREISEEAPPAPPLPLLSQGAVRRLMRNLFVVPPVVLACVSVPPPPAEGEVEPFVEATFFDGEFAALARIVRGSFDAGRCFRVHSLSVECFEGRRVLVLEKEGAEDLGLYPPPLQPRLYCDDPLVKEEPAEEEEAAAGGDNVALCTVTELAEATGFPRAVAVHALYVTSGSAADAFEYVSSMFAPL